MTDDTTEEVSTDAVRTLTASTTYKVLGELDADSGTGVLGRNTASSGTPIGVEGAVPNSSAGYGLSTPHDARVAGTAELAALGGAVTGNQQVSDLLGDGLAVSSGALSADPARPDLGDGSTIVSNADAVTFGTGLTVTDDGDGTATVELDTEWRQGPTLTPDADGDSGDEFGSAVAVSDDGTTVLVGTPRDEDPTFRGTAYVYELSDGRWTRTGVLSPEDGSDHFGSSVALSADGSRALVGATEDDDNGSSAGSAYVFDLSGDAPTQTTELTAGDGDDQDQFGWSVALSGDGTVALAGAPGDEDPNGSSAGSAYVFERSSGSWSETTKLSASDGDGDDRFGFAVAVDGDGTTAVVTAHHDDNARGPDAGGAYVFDGSGGWAGVSTETTKLTASDGDGDDRFGFSVGLSGDGTTTLVGASEDEDPNGTNAGSAYVFESASGSWSETTKLSASDGTGGDTFGRSVALSDDGTVALVGAPGDDNTNGDRAGGAYVFDGSGGWTGVSTETTKLTASDGDGDDRFGSAVAVNGDGTTALSGAPGDEDPNGTDAGSAYAFDGTGGWGGVSNESTKIALPTTGDEGDRFGGSVAVSDDGTVALVGAPEDENPNGNLAGAAYILLRNGGRWENVRKVVPADGSSDDLFGRAVALSADGSTALVGASRDDDPNGTDAGAAYVFERSGNNWVEATKLYASDGTGGDTFGWSVALSGDGTVALVGAYLDDNGNGSRAGGAYVFDGSGGWAGVSTETTKLTASDGDGDDRLGFSVGLSGDGTTALAGARRDEDPNGSEAGSAYVFDGSGGWSGVSSESTKLVASDGATDDRFGTSVALDGDGSTALVGAPLNDAGGTPDAGAGYVFDLTASPPTETKLTASGETQEQFLGSGAGLSTDATVAVLGARGAGNDGGGAVFRLGPGGWTEAGSIRHQSTADRGATIGDVLALSGDGATLLFGADSASAGGVFRSGAVYEFVEALR